MQTSDVAKRTSSTGIAAPGSVGDALRRWLGGPRGLVILGILVIAAGLAADWSWLTALGLAPLILSVAPCAAMCAFGVCAMSRGGESSCSRSGSVPQHSTSSAPADEQRNNV